MCLCHEIYWNGICSDEIVLCYYGSTSTNFHKSSIKHLQKRPHIVAEKSADFADQDEIKLTGSSCINISGDGTWKTRGYS